MNDDPLSWDEVIKLALSGTTTEELEQFFQYGYHVAQEERDFGVVSANWVRNASAIILQNPMALNGVLYGLINSAFSFGMAYNQKQKDMLESWKSFWNTMESDEDNENS